MHKIFLNPETRGSVMQQQIILRLLPSEAADEDVVKQHITQAAGRKIAAVTGYHLLKRSTDARGKQPYIKRFILRM